jgi:fructokinase
LANTLVSRAKHKVVALFGEVLVDVFPDSKVLGGAPFNVARHLRAFGLHPLLITRTGNDEIREQLLASMERFGMDASGVQCDASRPSGQVKVRIQGNKHEFEILQNQAYDYIHAGMAHMIALAARPELIYFGTLAQRNTTSRRALASLFRSTKSRRLLDINLRKPWYDLPIVEKSLLRADIVKMNEDELTEVSTMLRLSGKTPEESSTNLVKRFKLEQLLVTCGEQGAWLLSKNGKITYSEGQVTEKPMVDSVGAGDGFASVVILGLLNRWSAELTLSRANAFAAAICSIRGAIPSDQNFYYTFMEEWKGRTPSQSKAKTLYIS